MGMGEAVKGFRSAGGARFRDPSLNIGNNKRASGDINSGQFNKNQKNQAVDMN